MGKKTIDIPPGRVSIIREGGVEKRMGKGHVGESKKIERPARKPAGATRGPRVLALPLPAWAQLSAATAG